MSRGTSHIYDEDEESTRYVLIHHASLMTPLEARIVRAILVEEKADASPGGAMASLLRSRWGHRDDEEVTRALEAGPIACRRRIRDRLLQGHPDRVVIHRCPRCRRVARTPEARQCPWCGHDWH